jgi:hypothetical protein
MVNRDQSRFKTEITTGSYEISTAPEKEQRYIENGQPAAVLGYRAVLCSVRMMCAAGRHLRGGCGRQACDVCASEGECEIEDGDGGGAETEEAAAFGVTLSAHVMVDKLRNELAN